MRLIMKKLSKSALKAAKQSARKFKHDREVEKLKDTKPEEIADDFSNPDIDMNSDVVRSLISKGFKPKDITPAMIEHHSNKKSKVTKRQIKRSANLSSVKKPKISWNVECGDLVSFSHGPEEKFGIVLEVSQSGTDMNGHQSLIVSSSGRNWHYTKSIKKIN